MFVADAGIEPGVHDIHHQVAGDEADGDQQDHALDQRIIARKHGIHHQPADAGSANTYSVMTAPPIRPPNCSPSTVTTGISAFFSACCG